MHRKTNLQENRLFSHKWNIKLFVSCQSCYVGLQSKQTPETWRNSKKYTFQLVFWNLHWFFFIKSSTSRFLAIFCRLSSPVFIRPHSWLNLYTLIEVKVRITVMVYKSGRYQLHNIYSLICENIYFSTHSFLCMTMMREVLSQCLHIFTFNEGIIACSCISTRHVEFLVHFLYPMI